MGEAQDRQAMAIGGSTLESLGIEAQMHPGEQLFSLIAAAGKQGGAQSLHQGIGFQPNGGAALHQGQIREIFGGHAPHVVVPREAGELHLFGAFCAAQRDRAIGRQPGDDLTKQFGRQGDGSAGFNAGTQTGLDAKAEIKARETEATGPCIRGQQDVGQNGMGGATSHSTTHQLKAGAEFRLGANQLHGLGACRPDHGQPCLPTLPQAGPLRNVGGPP